MEASKLIRSAVGSCIHCTRLKYSTQISHIQSLLDYKPSLFHPRIQVGRLTLILTFFASLGLMTPNVGYAQEDLKDTKNVIYKRSKHYSNKHHLNRHQLKKYQPATTLAADTQNLQSNTQTLSSSVTEKIKTEKTSNNNVSNKQTKLDTPDTHSVAEIEQKERRSIPTLITEDGRKFIGQYYLDATKAIDSFLSGSPVEHKANDSYLKGEIRGTRFENGQSKTDFRLKAKIKLPHTQKKARIFFDSDLREENSLDERVRSISRGQQLEKSGSTAGIELLKQKANPFRWSQSIKGGMKLNNSFDPFIRYRLEKKWLVTDKTFSIVNQDLYYLDGVGWGESTKHRLFINPEDEFSLQIISELEYRDEPIPMFFYHQWSLTQRINPRIYFSYNISLLSEDSQKRFINKRVHNADFRFRLPGDWFYLTLSPEVLQQRESNWQSEWSLTMRLEFFFTEEQDSAFYRHKCRECAQ